MLQIASGKLFSLDVFRTNALRGVVYSNLILHGEHQIATVAGKLLGVNAHRRPSGLVFEFDERMEGDIIASGVIHSHGLDPYLRDFCAVASFFLKLTFSADIDLVKRLTSGDRGLATKTAPNTLIRQVFASADRVSPLSSRNGTSFRSCPRLLESRRIPPHRQNSPARIACH